MNSANISAANCLTSFGRESMGLHVFFQSGLRNFPLTHSLRFCIYSGDQNINSPLFGVISSDLGTRRVQFGVHYRF